MKQTKRICIFLLTSSLLILTVTVVSAESAGQMQIDREAMISELTVQWGKDDSTYYQLKASLEQANDSKLLAVWDAESIDEINRILRGDIIAPDELLSTMALGSADQDYTFTPVTPCRLVDTRQAGGAFSAGETREYFVYGGGIVMTSQGGNSTGCLSPVGEPRGVMINVTAVPSASSGNLRAYPANVSTPNASLVNFKPNVPNANATALGSYYAMGPEELEIYSSSPGVHVIVDLMGYFSAPEATAVDNMLLNTSEIVASGVTWTVTSPPCPSGWRLTGGGCNEQYIGQDNINSRPDVFTGTNAATRWVCQGHNDVGQPEEIVAIAVCSRTPGR